MKKTTLLLAFFGLVQMGIAQESTPTGKGEQAPRRPVTVEQSSETKPIVGNPAITDGNDARNRAEAERQRNDAAARTGSAVNPSMVEQQRYLNMTRTEISQLPLPEQAEAMRALGQQAMILNKESIVRASAVIAGVKTQLEAEYANSAPNKDRISQLEQRASSIANIMATLEAEQEKLIRLVNTN
jgi:hypothetical protein